MSQFKVGDTVICSIEVKDSTGAYQNPGTSMQVRVEQLQPNYAIKVALTNMTNDSTGKYHYDWSTSGSTVGTYRVSYVATDSGRVSTEYASVELI